MELTGHRTGLRAFLRALIRERPRRLAWAVVLQVLAGLAQGIGVLLLIPLLGAVGLAASGSSAREIRSVFTSLGVRPTLAVVLGVYVVITAAGAALNAYQGVVTTRYRLEFADHLRERLFTAVAHAEWRHLMILRQSDLLTAMTNNVLWVGLGAYATLSALSAGLLAVCQLAAAFGVSVQMTGLAIAAGALLLLVVWPLVRRSRALGRELVAQTQSVYATSTGFLDALKLSKAFGQEEGHLARFSQAVAGARRSQIDFARASGWASFVQVTLTALLLAVIVYLAVRSLHVGLSALLVVMFVFTRVVSQITSAQTNIQQMAQALPAFDSVARLVAECESLDERSVLTTTAEARLRIGRGVQLDRVQFAYRTPGRRSIEVLCGISLEIPAGRITALTGPSGAGKSTVSDLVAGLLRPTSGVVLVDERPLTPGALLAWRRSVALVPQEPFLFHDTIEANLLWALPDATAEQLGAALSAASAEFVQRLPAGLQTVVGDRGGRLSGGERQRLALARALLREPDLLILDEPTSSLDSQNQQAIMAALRGLRGQTTILLIAHQQSVLEGADQVIVLEEGRIVACERKSSAESLLV